MKGDIMKVIKYWILLILLLITTGCPKKHKYKRILPHHLKLTENTDEEALQESGDYIELFFDESDKPVQGYGYNNHEKWCYLNFDNRGRLASMIFEKGPEFDNTTIKYIYAGEQLEEVRSFFDGTLGFEIKIYYNSDNTISKIENVVNELIDDETISTDRYFTEFEFHNDYILENHNDKFKTRRKTYFTKNKHKVIYYDPIFAALYKPYQDKNMQVYKCEQFQGDKLIKVYEYDAFGSVKKESATGDR
jgi:Mg2+ and Co2+ transporter CorA